jgi:putative transcription antitermination factor YqgF
MLLALDIGTKKTGVALADRLSGVILALNTITHESTDDLVSQIHTLVQEKHIDEFAVGNPLLLSGEAGSQAKYVQTIIERFKKEFPSPLLVLDERFTSFSTVPCEDPDAMAACTLAELALQRPKESV